MKDVLEKEMYEDDNMFYRFLRGTFAHYIYT